VVNRGQQKTDKKAIILHHWLIDKDKGSYYKQEDFYYSTDGSNEDTNSNSEQVLSA
jgi:hypothetical protein